MPFTVSHVAVVLPFSRPLARWQLLPATIVGSMVPDFHFFLPWHMQRFESHSFNALWWFCLPVGLLSYWLFEYVMKPPLLQTLPDGAYLAWQTHARPVSIRAVRHWLLAAIGILMGAFTHLVWDTFTHEGSRGLTLLEEEPGLQTLASHHKFLVLRLAQDGSSLLGLLLVIAYVAYALSRPATSAPRRRLAPSERYGWWAGYVIATLALTWPIFDAGRNTGVHAHWLVINDLAIASLRALAMALLVVSVLLATRLRYLSSGASPEDDHTTYL